MQQVYLETFITSAVYTTCNGNDNEITVFVHIFIIFYLVVRTC